MGPYVPQQFAGDGRKKQQLEIVRVKSSPFEKMRRWKQATMVLSAFRLFGSKSGSKIQKEGKHLRAKMKANAHVVRAAAHLQASTNDDNGLRKEQDEGSKRFVCTEKKSTTPVGEFLQKDGVDSGKGSKRYSVCTEKKSSTTMAQLLQEDNLHLKKQELCHEGSKRYTIRTEKLTTSRSEFLQKDDLGSGKDAKGICHERSNRHTICAENKSATTENEQLQYDGLDMGKSSLDHSTGYMKKLETVTRIDNFGISLKDLSAMSKEHDISFLERNGGIGGIAGKLKTNLKEGICGDETDVKLRKMTFGSNEYPKKKRSFWRFIQDSCTDTTLVILMFAAVATSAFGIKTEGINRGWYEGASIVLAVLIFIMFTAVNNFKQFILIQKMEEEKEKIQVEALRGNSQTKVHITEIVAGDIVNLRTGDEVPADGLVITSHSLSVDESRMTGDSKIIHKDAAREPFLMAGSKVVDGRGRIMVTSVGTNTEWGLLKASSINDHQETPLQVRLDDAGTFIGIVAVVVSAVFLTVLVIGLFSWRSRNPYGSLEFMTSRIKLVNATNTFIKIFTVAVTIFGKEAREGLLLGIILVFAYLMKELYAKKVQAKGLSISLEMDEVKERKRRKLFLCI